MLNVLGPLMDGNRVVGIKTRSKNQIQECRAKLVIGADGATSAIARGLAVEGHPDRHLVVSTRGYLDTQAELDGTLEFAFLKPVLPGYAWTFPVGKHRANVGVALRVDVYKKSGIALQQYLQSYLDTDEMRQFVGKHTIQDVKTWQAPLASFQRKKVYDGAILVGDAGGFVNPLTGAGIYPAMITGKFAATVAIEAIQKGDCSAQGLATFETLWERELQPGIKYSALTQHFIEKSPVLIDGIVAMSHIFPGLMRNIISKF